MGKTFRRDDFHRPKKDRGKHKDGKNPKKPKEFKDDFFDKKKLNPQTDFEELETL